MEGDREAMLSMLTELIANQRRATLLRFVRGYKRRRLRCVWSRWIVYNSAASSDKYKIHVDILQQEIMSLQNKLRQSKFETGKWKRRVLKQLSN